MFEKAVLVLKLIAYVSGFFSTFVSRSFHSAWNRFREHHISYKAVPDDEKRNIVIVGASFAGYYVAKYLTRALPPGSPFRVVVIEPRSHFHFTWVLPRFSILSGHEGKALIPYGPFVAATSPSKLKWVRDRVAEVTKGFVRMKSGQVIPYEYLVIATGSRPTNDGLPSHLLSDDKSAAIREIKEMQENIRTASKLVVVGGGAAGVEIAADAKSKYSDKSITLVHSRSAVMHRFGVELQKEALKGLQLLGVEVILGERVVSENKDKGFVMLKSGRMLPYDFPVNCAGQRPASNLISSLSPNSLTSSGYIRVKQTMQIDDDALPGVYVCGDIAETHIPIANPNSRSAFCQALVVVDNIVLATDNKHLTNTYKPHWADSSIKLTLGLDRTIMYISDNKTTLSWGVKTNDIALDSRAAWKHLGAKPYEDPDYQSDIKSVNDFEENRIASVLK